MGNEPNVIYRENKEKFSLRDVSMEDAEEVPKCRIYTHFVGLFTGHMKNETKKSWSCHFELGFSVRRSRFPHTSVCPGPCPMK